MKRKIAIGNVLFKQIQWIYVYLNDDVVVMLCQFQRQALLQHQRLCPHQKRQARKHSSIIIIK